MVADTGVGVPADKQTVIFQPFEQVDNSSARRYGGTGLGLAISVHLARLMEGSIWLESPWKSGRESGGGPGSAFHFTVHFELCRQTKVQTAPSRPVVLEGVPVLVVDDHSSNRTILVEMLRQWGMRPVAVGSGLEALEALAAARAAGQPPELAILDMHMPQMDGFALAERIRGQDEERHTRLMILTSAGQRGDAAQCSKLGVDAYLLKPVKQSQLLAAVIAVLGREQAGQRSAPPVTRHTLRERRTPLTILLAEDNPVNQRLAVRLLEKQGHSVLVAGDGREALTLLEQHAVDLVLMDVQMPEMDGFEATAAIRSLERTNGHHLPIVAMTAHAMKGDRERCLAAGMDEYLAKPVQPGELYAVIERVVAGARG
jgi:CheY-like chemotaxis protein